ncbi:MAG TPA: XRE family transcriptional regulator [Candidatus Hydrogenedentes bacterium]|nr:XRE family transcriptional regulator [Candidatus Hydrogenedentota bacterium]HPG65896.1 XRE family transcriptional regulator [Candidatus Hydrogenedentota bacterium]
MIGERIKQARRMACLSLRELGARVGVSHQAIAKYEKGEDIPSSGVLLRLSEALEVGVDFFLQPVEVSVSRPEFRKGSRLGQKRQDSIVARVENWIARSIEVEQLMAPTESVAFRQPEGFPRKVSTLDDLEAVAVDLRHAWQLGLDPIQDLTEVFEEHGIRVGAIDTEPHFDALTLWANETIPVIVVRADIPGDRQRLSLAHELGHILLRPAGDEEKMMQRFAGALLVPASAARMELGNRRRRLDPIELHMLKHKYGMSMSAWIVRAHQLGIISDSVAKSLFATFSKRGWRKEEPGDPLPSETPARMARHVMQLVADEVISERRAKELLGRSLEDFRKEFSKNHDGFPAGGHN